MEQKINNDTICAVSTPAGVGGIAVVRVSGNDAIEIVSRIWRGTALADVPTHTAHFGRIVDASGEILDEVVATVFRAPGTFTGEDIVEISCHGSMWVQQQLTRLLIDAGCRMANGGEFTRRAFMNGRMDLSQAEAIADVIASSSRAAHRIAVSQMRGAFSRQLETLRLELLDFVALMELELDFSEEEVEFANREQLVKLATHIHDVISRLAQSFSIGNAIKNGIPVAIVGETNAGKSTLLNALLDDDRALVSDIHGTTRDVIEDTISVGGVMFRFIDTAGIRHTSDLIENMGIERTFKKLDEASIALWVIDGTTPVEEVMKMSANILPHAEGKELVAIINKVDRIDDTTHGDLETAMKQILPANSTYIFISAKEYIAIDSLQEILIKAARLPQNDANEVIVTNARHYEALTKADIAITRAIEGLHSGLSGDFVSQDIRECMHHLAEITGNISTTDILQTIFSRFCIGK